MKPLSLFITVLLLAGCAATPPELQTTAEEALLPFESATETLPAGQPIRWGGEVVRVNNLQEGSVIETVQFPLNTSGRPIRSDQSGGRFRIQVSGFIDPAIYTPGRLVTAIGGFSELEQGHVGDQPYTFPVLEARHVHLWPVVEKRPERCDCDPFFNSPLLLRPIILVPHKHD